MESTATPSAQSIQLKADFVPITVIRLSDCKLDQIKAELEHAKAQAPNFFQHAPVIVDIGGINEQLKSFLDLGELCNLIKELGITPIGIRGLSQKDHDKATAHGLAILNSKIKSDTQATEKKENLKAEAQKKSPKHHQQPTAAAPTHGYTKIVTKPVRNGTQIYAKGGDLLILAAVNAGAEVIADGNIHIHGPLRGRALAGAKGDKNARIFCQSLDAELIAIAGQYLVSDQFDKINKAKSMIHISLENDKLKIDMT